MTCEFSLLLVEDTVVKVESSMVNNCSVMGSSDFSSDYLSYSMFFFCLAENSSGPRSCVASTPLPSWSTSDYGKNLSMFLFKLKMTFQVNQ